MHRFRSTVIASALALSSLAIRAEDTAKPSPEPPPEDSIATAKKSFDSLSKKHLAEERGSLELPALATPEFNVGASMSSESAKAKAIAKPSKNWLVDGVMNKPTGKERVASSTDMRHSESTDSKESDSLNETEAASLSADLEGASARERAGSHTRANTQPAPESINPLASYMSSWISAQDRSLLLPPKNPDGSAASWDNSLANLAVAQPGPAAGGLAAENISLSQTALKASAQENPYLSTGGASALGPLTEPAPAANFQNFANTPPKVIDPIARAPLFDSSSQAASRQTARDLVKPDDNAKYFKQLKRF